MQPSGVVRSHSGRGWEIGLEADSHTHLMMMEKGLCSRHGLHEENANSACNNVLLLV